jgi:hypothetical protein
MLKPLLPRLKPFIPRCAVFHDPFAGQGDLMDFLEIEAGLAFTSGSDIEPRRNDISKLNAFVLDKIGDWIITNPPYLAKNKAQDKTVFDHFGVDDLFKAALLKICQWQPRGGIVIVPLNFFCSEDDRTRLEFLSNFRILQVEVFEDRAFDDIDYTVCAFSFIRHRSTDEQTVPFRFNPSGKVFDMVLKHQHGYRPGSMWFQLLKTPTSVNAKVSRLQLGGDPKGSRLFLRALDTGSDDGQISLTMADPFFGKNTDRSFATIVIEPPISEARQKQLCADFNDTLSVFRNKYNSLFLNTYRNNMRKRMSFDDAYKLIKLLLQR